MKVIRGLLIFLLIVSSFTVVARDVSFEDLSYIPISVLARGNTYLLFKTREDTGFFNPALLKNAANFKVGIDLSAGVNSDFSDAFDLVDDLETIYDKYHNDPTNLVLNIRNRLSQALADNVSLAFRVNAKASTIFAKSFAVGLNYSFSTFIGLTGDINNPRLVSNSYLAKMLYASYGFRVGESNFGLTLKSVKIGSLSIDWDEQEVANYSDDLISNIKDLIDEDTSVLVDVAYYKKLENSIRVAAVIRNIGSVDLSANDKLKTTLDLGIAKRILFTDFAFEVHDIGIDGSFKDKVRIGIETSKLPFVGKLRAGYNGKGVTFGAGIKLLVANLDFAIFKQDFSGVKKKVYTLGLSVKF